MNQDSANNNRQKLLDMQSRSELPLGYRQGIITAITVVLGFSLLFVRYWNFELPGQWTVASEFVANLLGLSILLQFISLWRALRVAEDEIPAYNRTLRWFLLSVVVLLLCLVLSALSYSHAHACGTAS
ncbi:MAG: hypothetical protein ABI076_10980 [Acidobacteriaceae bacterium]